MERAKEYTWKGEECVDEVVNRCAVDRMAEGVGDDQP